MLERRFICLRPTNCQAHPLPNGDVGGMSQDLVLPRRTMLLCCNQAIFPRRQLCQLVSYPKRLQCRRYPPSQLVAL